MTDFYEGLLRERGKDVIKDHVLLIYQAFRWVSPQLGS